MLLLLLSILAGAAPCPAPTQPPAVGAQVDDALMAWATLDEEGFSATAAALRDTLACLDAPLTPSQAAGAHRVLGLAAFLDGDETAALASFQAAALAEPGYTPTDRVAPEGGRLARLFAQAAKTAAPKREAIAVPAPFRVWVDGATTADRAPSLPAIVQVGSDGAPLRFSGWVPAGSPVPLPELGGGAAPADAPPIAILDEPTPRPRPSRGGPSPLWYAAAGTGAGAAGLFAASAVLRTSFDDTPTRGKFGAVNGTYFGSIGMAAVTAGLVGAAVASGRKGAK